MSTDIVEYKYFYFYGAGSQPNREILFLKDGQKDPKTVIAVVKALTPNGWIDISKLSADEIEVEMMSSSEKIRALKAERLGLPASSQPDKKLSELTSDQQTNILSNFEPIGGWRIEVTNGFGTDPRLEKVVRLNLFNPT